MRQMHRTIHIKGRKENNRGFDNWEGWGLGAMVCWRPQWGGERGGSGLNTDGGMWRVRYGGWREDRWMWGRRPSEEWPSVVSAVLWWRLSALIARPLPFELEQSHFCVCVFETDRERSLLRRLPVSQSSKRIEITLLLWKYLKIQYIAPNFGCYCYGCIYNLYQSPICLLLCFDISLCQHCTRAAVTRESKRAIVRR